MRWIFRPILLSRQLLLALAILLGLQIPAIAQSGCTDPLASNYNASATANNGSCTYPATSLNLSNQKDLPAQVNEGSALIYTDGNLWTLNDGGNQPEIYRINPANGTIVQTVKINATNVDWEDLAADATHIYIGDFGNNENGNRTNLRILQINKSDFASTDPAGVPATIILFTYPDQVIEDPVSTGPNATKFDCEAFFVKDGVAHLFTKDWLQGKTKHYSVLIGSSPQVATLVEEYPVNGLITGADYSPSGAVILSGYSSDLASAFVFLLGDYSGGSYFNGNKRKLNLGNTLTVGQIEGVTFTNGLAGYLSSEAINRTVLGFPVSVPPRLYSFDASNLVSLPVVLGAFTISQLNGQVRLDWTTNAEHNSEYFVVEHSVDGQQFNELGRKPAAGNSSIPTNYNYTDQNPEAGLNYYRLKQVDSDGNVSILGIRSITIAEYSGQMRLYPNPVAHQQLTIEYGRDVPAGLKYQLVNAAGATLGSGAISARRQSVNIGPLPRGQYFIKLSNGFSLPFIRN